MKLTDHPSQQLKSKNLDLHVPVHLHEMALRECSAFPVNLRSYITKNLVIYTHHLILSKQTSVSEGGIESTNRIVVGRPLEK